MKDPESTYYDTGGIDTLDIIKAKLSPVQMQGYLLGNTMKYVCRMFHKADAKRDCEKAIRYLKELHGIL